MYRNRLFGTLGRLHEGDGGPNFDILAYQETTGSKRTSTLACSAAKRTSARATGKCRKDVIKVDIGTESAALAPKPSKSRERVAAAKGMAASSGSGLRLPAGIEVSGTELVELLLLLRIG